MWGADDIFRRLAHNLAQSSNQETVIECLRNALDEATDALIQHSVIQQNLLDILAKCTNDAEIWHEVASALTRFDKR